MGSYFKGSWSNRKPDRVFRKRFTGLFPKLWVYDLGAAGGTPPPFLFLGDAIGIVTFEPDPGAEVEEHATNCPTAVGPPDLTTLYLNRRPTTSSLLRPNKAYVDRYDWERNFPGQGDIFETVREVEIGTEHLDDAIASHSLPAPDFLKIDVQGLTQEVLEGATKALENSILGIQVEVEFGECYEGQKTMGVIHEFLSGMGYEIYRVSNLNRWFFKTRRDLKRKGGQDTFCDLLYLPPVGAVGSRRLDNSDKVLKLIELYLLHDCNDAAVACLEDAIEKGVLDETASEILDLAAGWEGALEMFYHPRALERFITVRGHSLLDTSPRQLYQRLRRLVRKGKRATK